MKTRTRLITVGVLIISALAIPMAGCSSTPAPQQNAAETAASPTPADAATGDAAGTSGQPAAGGQPSSTGQPGITAPPAAGGGSNIAGGTGGATGTAPAYRPTPTPAPPRTYTITAGRPITIWTSEELSTKTARPGQRFSASLANAIVDDDWVIAKQGAPVEGVIVSSDPGGRVKGRASLSIRLESLTLADGRTVNLSTGSYTKQAKSTVKKDAIKTGIGAGVGAAIGAIAGGGKGAAIGAGAGAGAGAGVVMATRGDPAVIPSESKISFRLQSPITVTKR